MKRKKVDEMNAQEFYEYEQRIRKGAMILNTLLSITALIIAITVKILK